MAGSTFQTNPFHLSKLLDDCHDGVLQLPDFQRSWVWDEDRIKSLIASISRAFPVGALMTLETSLGACGGRASARNQRARRALVATPPEAVPPPAIPQQTTAEAIHLLDTQFPWLRGAERKRARNRVWVPALATCADQN